MAAAPLRHDPAWPHSAGARSGTGGVSCGPSAQALLRAPHSSGRARLGKGVQRAGQSGFPSTCAPPAGAPYPAPPPRWKGPGGPHPRITSACLYPLEVEHWLRFHQGGFSGAVSFGASIGHSARVSVNLCLAALLFSQTQALAFSVSSRTAVAPSLRCLNCPSPAPPNQLPCSDWVSTQHWDRSAPGFCIPSLPCPVLPLATHNMLLPFQLPRACGACISCGQ